MFFYQRIANFPTLPLSWDLSSGTLKVLELVLNSVFIMNDICSVIFFFIFLFGMEFCDNSFVSKDGKQFKVHSCIFSIRYKLYSLSPKQAIDKLSELNSPELIEIFEYIYCGLQPSEKCEQAFKDIEMPFPNPEHCYQEYLFDMKKLYVEKKFADFKIKCKSKTFIAHKFILAANSEFFNALFHSGFEEDQTHTLEDCFANDPKQIENMLQYMYNGTIEVKTLEECFQFLYICKKYLVIGPNPREPETYVATIIASNFLSQLSEATTKAHSYDYKVLYEILSACSQM